MHWACENCGKVVLKKKCDACKDMENYWKWKEARRVREKKVKTLSCVILREPRVGATLLAQMALDSGVDLQTLPAKHPILHIGLGSSKK
jgi:hypothetical protein